MSTELVIAKQVAGALQKMAPEYRAVLPSHITPEAFTRVAQTAIQMNEDLQNCTPKSLIAACTRLAEIGLLPNGEDAAIVAYSVKVSKNPDRWEKQAKAMPMIAGLRDLVRRSGQVRDWKFRAVYSQDHFEHIDGDVERLTHIPAHAPNDRLVKVYAIAYLENGELSRCVMTIEEIEAIRRRSKTPELGPWKSDFVQMALKSVGRRHYKALPRAKDDIQRQRLMGAIRAIDDADGIIDVDAQAPRLEAPPVSMHEAARQRLADAVDNGDYDRETGEIYPAGDEEQPPSTGAQPAKRGRRTAADKLADVEAGRVERMRAAEEREAAKKAATNGNGHGPQPVDEAGDQDPGREMIEDTAPAGFRNEVREEELGDEEPECAAFRDGWNSRFASRTRTPPRTLNHQRDVSAFLQGYDAAQKTVDIGNTPGTPQTSKIMCDNAISKLRL